MAGRKAKGHPSQNAGNHTNCKPPYAGGGSSTMKAAKSTTNAFKCGGKVMGNKSKSRMDKYARGGRAGGSPFSSAKISENTAASRK